MMKQQYFSDSEWVTLLEAPRQAVLAVVLADKTDPVAFLQEVQSALQIFAAELQRDDFSSDLVKSVVADLKRLAAQDPLQGEQLLSKQQSELLASIQSFKSTSDGQKQVIAYLNQVRDVLIAKVPIAEAEAFKQWILALATQVARAVKEEGRFGGIGGERISRQESGALSAVEKAFDFKL